MSKNNMEWISVKDRLPKDSGRYLIFLKGSVAVKIETACYIETQGKWKAAQAMAIFQNVTHWMPLPEPPKMEVQG